MAHTPFKNPKIGVRLLPMTLKAQIENSQLPQEDKNFWFSVLGKLDDMQTKIFEDFVDGKEENLRELTENIKAKRVAFGNLDENTLDKILEQET